MRKGAKFAKIYVARFYPALINPHKVHALRAYFALVIVLKFVLLIFVKI